MIDERCVRRERKSRHVETHAGMRTKQNRAFGQGERGGRRRLRHGAVIAVGRHTLGWRREVKVELEDEGLSKAQTTVNARAHTHT